MPLIGVKNPSGNIVHQLLVVAAQHPVAQQVSSQLAIQSELNVTLLAIYTPHFLAISLSNLVSQVKS